MGARAGDGTGSSVRESAGEMGRSAPTRPRQNARKGQGSQRAPLLQYSLFLAFMTILPFFPYLVVDSYLKCKVKSLRIAHHRPSSHHLYHLYLITQKNKKTKIYDLQSILSAQLPSIVFLLHLDPGH